MRVGLVVERRYFAKAVAPVEGLGLGQRLVGFESEQRKPSLSREILEVKQDPGPNAETTGGGRDPHALDLAKSRMTLQGAAPDRLSMERRQHEVTVRWRELPGRGRDAERRIETGFETGPELVEIARKTVARRRTDGVFHGEAHGAAPKQALDGLHGGEQGRALRFREGVEERRGSLVRQPIQNRQLFAAPGGEGHETHARVARRWLGANQSLRLELSQQAAGVARVQGQTGTQLPDLDPVLADLKEDAACAERPGAAEKAPSQCSDLLGHRAIEASHLGDAVHTSDISQRYGRRQAIGLFPWAACSFLRHGLFSEDLL